MKKRVTYFVFSVAVTVGVFSYLLTKVSLREVVRLVKEADMRGILLFICLSLATSAFRLWRYGIMLRLSGYAPNTPALFLVVLVRNFFSDLLPARIGALIYVYLANTRLGVPFAAATSSFSLSFVFDLIALAPLLVLSILAAGFAGKMSPFAVVSYSATFAAILAAVLFALPGLFRLSGRILAALPVFKDDWKGKAAREMVRVSDEVLKTKRGGAYSRLLILSLLIRIGKYGSLYWFLFALLAPLGYGPAQLSVPKVFLGLCAAELAASMPVSGIAGFGVYEGTWALVFSLLGFPKDIAILTGMSHHLFTQVYGYSLGALALATLMLPVFKAKQGPEPQHLRPDTPARFCGKAAAAVLTVALIGIACYALPARIGAKERAPADIPAPSDIGQTDAVASAFPGRILFDSDRSGTFGIYSMKPDGSDIGVVFDGPREDMYPDPSPGGDWVVFASAATRSRRSPSEIRICRRDGTDARKLTDDGTFPTFASDGRTVYFERGRAKVMAVGTDGRNEREIFPGPNPDFRRYEVVKPRVSPDGRRVAFISDRKGAWNTWYADLATCGAVHIAGGCEATWFADSASLAWISTADARERTGIFRFDIETRKVSTLHDDDAPRGHEYFPTIAAEDGFLLWSACRPGEHDHVNSNYQIFVKDLKRGAVARMTFDEYNNRWPKLLPDAR